jgi:protein-L-isoaspartate(D-aspartate) O-methyltransferase
MGYQKIKTFFGDGFAGLPAFAPFDKVIITAAAPELPKKLIDQMMIGGQMVIPLDDSDSTKMKRITKIDEQEILVEQFIDCSFVPMLKGKNY